MLISMGIYINALLAFSYICSKLYINILWAIIKHKQAFVGGALDMGVESGEGRWCESVVVEGVLIVGQLVGHICQSDLAMCCVSNGANFQVSQAVRFIGQKRTRGRRRRRQMYTYIYICNWGNCCKPERRSKFQHLYLHLLWAKIYCAAQSENCKTISAKAQIKYDKKQEEEEEEKRIKATKLQFK